MSLRFPSVTKRASAAISKLMAKLESQYGMSGYVPVVNWMVDSSEPGFVPGPCIAIDKRENLPVEYVLQAHGVELAFGLTDEKRTQFENMSLDFIHDRFLFIDDKMAKFTGA